MRRHTRDMAFWSDSDDMRYSIPRIGPTILDISNDDFQLQRADKRLLLFVNFNVYLCCAKDAFVLGDPFSFQYLCC